MQRTAHSMQPERVTLHSMCALLPPAVCVVRHVQHYNCARCMFARYVPSSMACLNALQCTLAFSTASLPLQNKAHLACGLRASHGPRGCQLVLRSIEGYWGGVTRTTVGYKGTEGHSGVLRRKLGPQLGHVRCNHAQIERRQVRVRRGDVHNAQERPSVLASQ